MNAEETMPESMTAAAGTPPAAARHRPWYAIAGDIVIGTAMVGSMILVPVIGSQNGRLRSEVAGLTEVAGRGQGMDATLRRNIEMGALGGNTLPASLAAKVREALATNRRGSRGAGVVLMIYTPMACERSLQDGLRSLREHPAVTRGALAAYALVGERGAHDREAALLLRADGVFPFPMMFAPADSLLRTIFASRDPLRTDSTFDEEPIYLRLDENLRIRSAFHGDQRRPALLDRWLETVQ